MQATCAAEGLIKRRILGDAVAHDGGLCIGSGPRHVVVSVRTRSPRAALGFSMEPRQISAGGDVLRRVAALRVRCSDNVRRGAARRCGWSCLPQFLRRGSRDAPNLAANVVRTTERRELRGSGCPAHNIAKPISKPSRQLVLHHLQDPSGDSRGVFFRKPAVLREEDVGLPEFQILAPQNRASREDP